MKATGLLALLCAAAAVCATDAPTMRRLTHSQYNHSVHDLLGDETNPANRRSWQRRTGPRLKGWRTTRFGAAIRMV